MEFIGMFLLTSIGGFILYLITNAFVKAPGSLLQTQFQLLTKDTNGTIAGKTYDEVVKACGAPNSVSPLEDGGKLCQWMATSYHIALIFDADNICKGISHEVKV